MRLIGSFSKIVYHLSCELGLYWLFFHSYGKERVSIHWLKIRCKGLQIDLPQILVTRILILSWPWALFGSKFYLIFSISLSEKFTVSKGFSVVKWRLRGSSILSLIKEHCFAMKELKSSDFFLKSVACSFPWKRGGLSGTFLLFKKAF